MLACASVAVAIFVAAAPAPAGAGAITWPVVELRPVVSGLNQPLAVVDAGDNSGRLYVVEKAGVIRVVEAGRLLATPFLDIHTRVRTNGEQGLLGLAFSPDFATSGLW
jgi:glucose/arabinose dehydrogenase